MSSLDIPSKVGEEYQKIFQNPLKNTSPTYAQWALFEVNSLSTRQSQASTLEVTSSGEGELDTLLEEFNDGKVQFAFVKVTDPNSQLAKCVLISWCGESVKWKGLFPGYANEAAKFLSRYHVQINARSEDDLDANSILQKVSSASGANYGGAIRAPPPKPANKPIIAAKPVYKSATVTGTLPIGGRPPAPVKRSEDNDGWGDDAPPTSVGQLQPVSSAYTPTKVDIKALKAQPTATTSAFSKNDDSGDIVKGGYQPIGKIDIAALKKGYKEERPEPVKGSYTPVDVSSIKKAAPGVPSRAEPEEDPVTPVSVSNRASMFSNPSPSQAERLTSLPKPKVAKKFGTGAPAPYAVKTPAPAGFGSPVSAPNVQIGSISKSGITKSPAQIWAEKKARERGESVGSDAAPQSPAAIQTPSYTGASASSAKNEDDVMTSSAGGVNALRNRFSGAPMGAPTSFSPQNTGNRTFSPQHTGARSFSPAPAERAVPPPPPPAESRPAPAAPVVPIPVPVPVPVQQEQEEEEEEELPPPPAPRAVTPPPAPVAMPESPIRLVNPVAREEPVHEPTPAAAPAPAGGKPRAIVLYDYTADEENEINLIEGQVVVDIDMVDEDWWSGTNQLGQEGLFPSNYVEIIGGDDSAAAAHHEPEPARAETPEPVAAPAPVPVAAPAPAAPAAAAKGRTALAIYDYEATEENELSFPENAIITDIEFPDEDWWQGTYKGREGLFPANYVELQE